MRRDPVGIWFDVERAKTGEDAKGTLRPRATRLLQTYMASLPAKPMPAVPIFRNRSGRPYSKDTLGDDFRDIRGKVFGPDEKRQIADFRRSGAVEALNGGVNPAQLANKMGNTINHASRLQKVYLPVQLEAARVTDDARVLGRHKMREQSGKWAR